MAEYDPYPSTLRHNEIETKIGTGSLGSFVGGSNRDCGIDIFFLVEYLRELEERIETLEKEKS